MERRYYTEIILLDFYETFIKDMKIALIEANQCELDLDVLSQTLANYEVLEAEGYGDLGTQDVDQIL